MQKRDTKIETVDEYIKKSPRWAQGVLKDMRKAIRVAVPGAKESISYHIPYYSYNGRLAYLSVAKEHSSFHWINAQDKKTFAKELKGQTVVGQTLRIPRISSKGGKAPVALIKKIVRARAKSNTSKK